MNPLTHRRTLALALLAALSLTSACATTAKGPAATIIEADERMVENCRFLGSVTGKSLIGGAAQRTGANNAKVDARKAAARLGATHIVFTDIDGGGWYDTGEAQGRAYKCEN